MASYHRRRIARCGGRYGPRWSSAAMCEWVSGYGFYTGQNDCVNAKCDVSPSHILWSYHNISQEIRSVELGVCPMQLFSFFDHVTFIQFKICCCVQNFIESGWFFIISELNVFHTWQISIFKMAAVRHLGIVLQPYETTHEVSVAGRSCLSNFMSICYTDDTDLIIWRYSYLNFSHICLEMPIQAPKIGVLRDFGPLNVIIHHWDPQKGTSLRKSAYFKLSTVKIRWGAWPVGELTESVMDTHITDGNIYTHR